MTVSGSTWIAIMGLTERGFTGHQHVDRLDLIHMNGRTYDPKVGRFMQADVFVPHPGDTQSYNRYSYVRNNPLNATDPTGYFDLKDGLKMVGAAVAAYYTFGWDYGAFEAAAGSCFAAGSGAAIGAGAASGAAAGFVSGGIMGGNMEGALQGAFSGAVFGGIGGMFNTATLGGHVMSGATQAVAGGGISVMQGGKFGHGFVSAGVTAVAMPAVNTQRGLVRVAAAAVVGGTASVASGGKFANGAMTAAFQAAVTSGAQSSSAGKSSGAASTIGGILGKIWNLPNTLIGMAYGGVGHVIGEVGNVLGFYSAEPTISFGHNAIQFENNPLMATAMTFGNTIVYGKGSDYQPNVR